MRGIAARYRLSVVGCRAGVDNRPPTTDNAAAAALPQPSRHYALPSGVIEELAIGAFGALEFELRSRDLLFDRGKLRGLIGELGRLVAEGEEAGDLGPELFGAVDQQVELLLRPPHRLLV